MIFRSEPSSGSPPGRPARPGLGTDRTTKVALCSLIAMLAVANVARSALVPGDWHFVFNVSIGVVAGVIAIAARLSSAELGLDRRHLPAGLRLGSAAFALTSAVVLAAGLTGVVSDDSTDVSLREMLLRTLVVIPLATVLVEELAFRGVLHGLLRRLTSPNRTMVLGAVLFGLWHVFPTWRGGAAGGLEATRAVAAAGTFAATTVAGFAFVWLRARSGRLVAPVLLHLATNSVTFAVVWAS